MVLKWVDECFVFSAKWDSCIMDFDEMMMISDFYQTNTFSWNFIVLVYWNNSPWLDMSSYSDKLDGFQSSSYSWMMRA
jgi:hypothetical protein